MQTIYSVSITETVKKYHACCNEFIGYTSYLKVMNIIDMKPSCNDIHKKKMKIMKVPFEQLYLQYYNKIIFE